MVAITAGGGLNSWIPGKQQYESKASLNKGSLSFKCCALKICATIAIPDPGKVLSPRSIALLHMDSLVLDLFVNRGTLDGIALEVISIACFQHATRLKLLQCRAGEENGSGGEPGLRLLFDSEGAASEVHISLPSTQVWLHAAAWSEVGPTIAASMNQSSTQTTTSTDSNSQDLPEQHDSFANKPLNPLQKADLLVLQEAVPPQFPSLSRRLRSSSKQLSSHEQNGLEVPRGDSSPVFNTATVLVKVGKFRLTFLMLDYSGEADDVDRVYEEQEEPFTQEEPILGKLLSCSLSLRVDEFRVNKDNTWTLAAGITEGEGNIVEDFEEQEPFREMCCQATEIGVTVEGSFQQSPSVRFNMRVHADCINFWCSNRILHFFHNFTFEDLQTGPPTTLNVEGRVDMRLQHASLLLSDGRVSFPTDHAFKCHLCQFTLCQVTWFLVLINLVNFLELVDVNCCMLLLSSSGFILIPILRSEMDMLLQGHVPVYFAGKKSSLFFTRQCYKTLQRFVDGGGFLLLNEKYFIFVSLN